MCSTNPIIPFCDIIVNIIAYVCKINYFNNCFVNNIVIFFNDSSIDNMRNEVGVIYLSRPELLQVHYISNLYKYKYETYFNRGSLGQSII